MYPLPIITYVKMALVALVLCLCFYSGYRFEKHRFEAYKVEQQTVAQKKADEYQAATDEIRKIKDDEIADINAKLFASISELRKRPSRPNKGTSNGQGATGASLYAEDAIFLRGEAARADVLRSALEACYNQYDAIRK
jgi:hypothetical protein